MPETDYAAFEPKSEGDRTLMHILYGLHTVAWASMGTLAVIALVLNYVKRSDEHDAVYASHHSYMIATFWWTVLWLVVTSPLWLFFVLPGVVAYTIIGLWYLYRCLRGWLRFSNNRPPY
ncbi:DUF4870 family protein [Caenimonas aquaedulcis]|uniref:Transmembrane protein n=1 Tax=Caenimonas aquaedulcis TaxID=2793270 RepID=A0A931H776_9BURK|nr:hypothetical protein [Caenimonas aquaedulcis]MBG9389727.1 hypothetical protein [Caenimonas aquaedulcis]